MVLIGTDICVILGERDTLDVPDEIKWKAKSTKAGIKLLIFCVLVIKIICVFLNGNSSTNEQV
jgi:hypothetical protein